MMCILIIHLVLLFCAAFTPFWMLAMWVMETKGLKKCEKNPWLVIPSDKHTKNIKKLWKDPPFSMGKSTISTGSCSIAMLVITRG